ncbi:MULTISPECIES: hypothetical protein [unclassified Nocardiopsis]|uniref:hypothetical protein n=1 Tax=Nocardiopsis TaxID=2013 RepID=UPI00387B4F61
MTATVEGVWELSITTPIGRLTPTVEFTRTAGVLTGTARDGHGEVELREPAVDGDRLTWHQSVTRPMRLNLFFDLTLDGDTMHGTSRAGRLPASKVTARRAGTP